jgi:hypothetical protein
MAKVTLTFEYESPQEPEIQAVLKATALLDDIKAIDNYLRSKLKHGDCSEDTRAAYEDVRTRIHDVLLDLNLT